MIDQPSIISWSLVSHAVLTSQETIEYCRQRQAFGRPLLDNQYLHYKLAEMKTEVEMLRAGLYRQELPKPTTTAPLVADL